MNNITRKQFLATGASLLATTQLPAQTPAAAEASLALHGGPKALKAHPRWVRWGEPELQRLTSMLEQPSLFYWEGPQTKAFTERLQKHHPLKHVMTCSSGTAALHIAVAAVGVGPGDEVITTPITDIGTVTGILFQQGVPVFADLELATANVSVETVARCITPRTKAIIAVHLTGNPCDLRGLRELADRHGLALIEDCAQAWGARYEGKPVGTVGHVACFSMMDSKLIGCGDGGVVGSNDERYGPLLQKFGDKGADRIRGGGYAAVNVLATNYRMSEPQAAVAAAQLDRLENIAERRHHLGLLLTREVADVRGFLAPAVRPEDRCTFWFYLARIDPAKFGCDNREFARALAAEGVRVSAGYIQIPVYGAPMFQQHSFFAGRWPIKEMGLTKMDYSSVKCPNAEEILGTCVQIRFNEAMTDDHVRQIAQGIRKIAAHYRA